MIHENFWFELFLNNLSDFQISDFQINFNILKVLVYQNFEAYIVGYAIAFKMTPICPVRVLRWHSKMNFSETVHNCHLQIGVQILNGGPRKLTQIKDLTLL